MTAKRKTTRRDFISGRSTIEALSDLADGAGAVQTDRPPPDTAAVTRGDRCAKAADETNAPPPLMQIARRAMACQFEVVLGARRNADAVEAAIEALDLVDRLEDQMSIHRDHSEIMAINRRAAGQPVLVEPQLFELLRQAVDLHAATGGAFDVTAGPLAKVWGFYRRQGRIPGDADLEEARRRVGSRHLQLDLEKQTIQFTTPGVEIDLGGIGKGYALDRCARLLLDAKVDSFLLHGGQSSLLARGHRDRERPVCMSQNTDRTTGLKGERNGKEPPPADVERGWLVGVRHPLRPDRRLAEVRLCDRAMGTSGSGTQFFTYRGRRYGHILNPRTGRPAAGVLSASVIARSAATADALATAFYVMGVEKSFAFCSEHPELAALIVTPGGRRGSIELHVAGLPEDQWRRVDDPREGS